jgi:desulfoferrodoxin (superoxide reductase-like protein)
MNIQKKAVRKNPMGRGRLRRCASAACILVIALVLTLLPAPGAAHSPKEVVITYDQAKHMLEVRITHGVSDPAKHFVEAVEIRKGGKTISKTEYQSQPGPTTFVYTYPLDADPTDVIEVKASCSVFGSTTEKLDLRKIPR